MKKVNYWHMQIHRNNKKETHVYLILEHKKIIGLGNWGEGERPIATFRDDMKVNDIVAIKNGEELVALVQVIGGFYEVTDDMSEETGWIENRRPIRVLDWVIDDKIIPDTRKTLKKCVNDVPTTQIIKKWHEQVMTSYKQRKLDHYV